MNAWLQRTIVAAVLLVGSLTAHGQQYDVTAPARCIAAAGDTVMLHFNGVPSPASGGTVTFYFEGDLDGTGSNLEAFDFYSENGSLLTSSTSIGQCSGFDSVTYTIPFDSLITWGSDGTIFFIADATQAVGPTVCTQGTCASARLQYTFVTVPNDIRVSSFDAPKNFCAGNEDIIVTISNAGTNQVTSAQVNWTFDGVVQTAIPFSGLLDTVGGTGASAAQVTLGNRNFSSGASHDIVAWTSQPNGTADANPLNDTLSVLGLRPALAGTFTIGTTGDFPDLTSAVAALNSFGVCGPVTFNIASGTYTEQVALGAVTGASTTNTITFQSATGNAGDVTISSNAATSTTNYVFLLNGSEHVRITNLTVENSNASFGTCFRLEGNCNDIEIDNCVINGPSRGSTTSNLSTIFGTGSVMNDIVIQDCDIIGGSYGVYLRGVGSGTRSTNCIIRNNRIESYYRGASLYYHDAIEVHGNTIVSNTFSTYNFFRGVECSSCDNGSTITANQINAETGSYGIYLTSSTGTATTPNLIANNFVHVGGTSTAYGIYLSSTLEYIDVYHNSVNITSTSISGRAFFISGTGTDVDVVNNILNNEGIGYAIYLSSSVTLDTVNYNLLHTQGNNLAYYVLGPYSTLGDYQNVSGLDANSVDFAAPFVSSTDLHVTPIMNETGTPVPYVTADIDGDPRDPVRPDIGADEIVPAPVDMATIALLDPVSGCGLSTAETIRAVFASFGNDPVAIGTTVQVSYAIDGGVPTTETLTLQKVLNFRDTVIYTFNTPADLGLGGDYDLDIAIAIAGDGDPTNDELSEVVTNNSAPSLPQVVDFEGWGPISTDQSCSSIGATAQQGWTQDDEDDGNWNVNSGPTPTAGSGPLSDFRPGTTNGKYLYVEAEFPCYGNDYEVNLLSPCIDLQSLSNPGLNFAYHMYGSNMGSLHIDIVRGSLVIPDAWTVSGDQGNQWHQAVVDLSKYATFGEVRVRIRATIGTFSRSDIAIDDLRLGNLPNVQLGNSPITDCGFVDLDAKVANATYEWNTGDTTRSIRITNTGNQPSTATYAVTVTKNSLFNIDTIEVTLEPGPVVDLGPDVLTVCEVDTVTLDAGNPGMKHQWENGFFAQKRLIQAPGTYWVTVDDLKGCVKADTIEVQFNETPTASFTYGNVSGLSRLTFNAPGTADNDYLWSFGDGSGSTVQNPTHLFAGAGTYTVSLVVSNDCGADTMTQQVDVWPTGIEDPAAIQSIQLVPNPTTDIVQLQMEVATPGDWTASLLDVSGRMLEAVNFGTVQAAVQHTFDLQHYAKGMYFLRLQSEHGQLLRKIIVQ